MVSSPAPIAVRKDGVLAIGSGGADGDADGSLPSPTICRTTHGTAQSEQGLGIVLRSQLATAAAAGDNLALPHCRTAGG